MVRRTLFSVLSAFSLLLCLMTAVAWASSNCMTWQRGGVRISEGVRIGMSDGWIAFYNQSEPFFNGTIGMASAYGPPPGWPRESSLRFPGFHFRHFTWPGKWPGDTFWTFALWLGYPFVLTAVLPTIWLTFAARIRCRAALNQCLGCGYKLAGNTSGVCPECGTKVGEPKTATA